MPPIPFEEDEAHHVKKETKFLSAFLQWTLKGFGGLFLDPRSFEMHLSARQRTSILVGPNIVAKRSGRATW